MRRRGLLATAVALILPVSAAHTDAASRSGATATSAELAIGDASLMPSTNSSTVVTVPVTLSVPLTTSLSFSFRTTSGTATAGANYVAARGRSSIGGSSNRSQGVERSVQIRIPAQSLASSVSFGIVLFDLSSRDAELTNGVGLVTLLPNSPSPPASMPVVAIGGSSIYKAVGGPDRSLQVCVTVASKRHAPLEIRFHTAADDAVASTDYAPASGTLRFGRGVTERVVTLSIKDVTYAVPNRVFYVDIASSQPLDELRSTGVLVIVTGASSGLVDDETGSFDTATLTPDRSPSTKRFDTFGISSAAGAYTMFASDKNSSGNSRFVYYPSREAPSLNQESCATWLTQTPANGSGTTVQEGVALRVVTSAGITRAITVTKEVYGSNDHQEPVNATFDILLWDSSRPQPGLIVEGRFALESLWPNGQYVPFPWDICARAVGPTVSFLVWPADMAQPVWGDPEYGGAVTIPPALYPNWSQPGYGGWYFGHLYPNATMTYSDLSVQKLSA